MRKVNHSVISFLVVVLLIFSCTITAFAVEDSYTNKYVSLSSFTYITGDFKDTYSTTAAVLITSVQDEAGTDSNKFVMVRTISGSTPRIVRAGTSVDISLPESCRDAGSWVPMYAKGEINCRISGYWNIH